MAGPMEIDDSSISHQVARSGQAQLGPGPDQDMNEVAEILLKMNVNLNSSKQRRYVEGVGMCSAQWCSTNCGLLPCIAYKVCTTAVVGMCTEVTVICG